MKIWQNNKHKLQEKSYVKGSLSLSSIDFRFSKQIIITCLAGVSGTLDVIPLVI